MDPYWAWTTSIDYHWRFLPVGPFLDHKVLFYYFDPSVQEKFWKNSDFWRLF